MISEGSCDTEDWSNDAENSAFHHWNFIWLYIQIDNILNYNKVYSITDFTVFLHKQLSIKAFKKLYRSQTFEW